MIKERRVINRDWKSVFKRYSFITHLLIAISSVGMMALVPFMDYIPVTTALAITAILSIAGLLGSFIQQRVNEKEK